MYPFDIPKLNQAEYQDERGEIGDKYQISDILKSIKTHKPHLGGAMRRPHRPWRRRPLPSVRRQRRKEQQAQMVAAAAHAAAVAHASTE